MTPYEKQVLWLLVQILKWTMNNDRILSVHEAHRILKIEESCK